MKLIIVEADFGISDLEAAIALFAEQARTVQAMDGCAHYALYRKPSGDGVAIIQKWDTMEAFDAYRRSETFAILGQGLRPLMTAPPVTVIAEIDKV